MQTEIKQHPILFSTQMVQAILGGRKTMTRRSINQKNQPYLEDENHEVFFYTTNGWCVREKTINSHQQTIYEIKQQFHCPYGKVGDVLWVRETFYELGAWQRRHNPKKNRMEWYFSGKGQYAYLGDPLESIVEKIRTIDKLGWWKRPALFMPKEACRQYIQITDIRVERLQDISEEDAIEEGVERLGNGWTDYVKVSRNEYSSAKDSFYSLWKSLNGPESCRENPWVWVVSYERIAKPE